MNKEYVIGQALGGLGEMNAMLKKIMSQMRVNDPKEAIRRINSGEWVVVVSKVLSYITSTFTITVDETVSVEDAVKIGKFDWDHKDIVSKNFPKTVNGQKSDKEVVLFHFNKPISSEEVIAEMDRGGYKPANIWELIGLFTKTSGFLRKFSIVALGSVCKSGSGCVPYLYFGSLKNFLQLRCIGHDWDDRYSFAGVRK